MQNVTYCINGVWDDTRSVWSVKTVKIINLSIRSYLERDLQMRSCALTYNTVLAVVPALAMLFAIARGFGFQNLLQSELFRYFPAQRQALETALTYVDNYLAQASQGIFIGIGLIFSEHLFGGSFVYHILLFPFLILGVLAIAQDKDVAF